MVIRTSVLFQKDTKEMDPTALNKCKQGRKQMQTVRKVHQNCWVRNPGMHTRW